MLRERHCIDTAIYGPPPKVPTTFSVNDYENSRSSPSEVNAGFQLIKKCYDELEKIISKLDSSSINDLKDIDSALVLATGLTTDVAIRSKLWRVCREITHQKITRPDIRTSNNGSTIRNKPVNQATVIREFWYYIISRIKGISRVMIQRYQNIHDRVGDGNYYDSKIFDSFCLKYGFIMRKLYLVITYVLENYTKLVIGDQPYTDGTTIMQSILIGSMMETYNDKFPAFINEFLDSQRVIGLDKYKWRSIWVPLIRVPDTVDMMAIYLDNVEKYYSRDIHSPVFVGPTFATGLQEVMVNELELALQFTELNRETLYRKVWGTILFKANLYSKMFELCKNDTRYNKQGALLFRTVVTKFCRKVSQNGRIDLTDYLNAQTSVINRYLEGCFNPIDKGKLIKTVCDLHEYFCDPDQEEILKNSVNDLLRKENLSMMDIFLETFKNEISSSIEELNKLSELAKIELPYSDRRTLVKYLRRSQKLLFPHSSYINEFVKLPKIFRFGSSLPKIICDYSFKELLLNFNDFSMLFRIRRSPLMKMIVELNKGYSSSDDMITLEILSKEVSDMSKLVTAYNLSNEHEMLKSNLIVLQRSKYNDQFSENDYKDIKVPPEIHEQWDKLMTFYRQRITNGELRDVTPIYQLQRCEVNCPFAVPGYDKDVTFDVTLMQACVLQEFNDKDELSFNEIYKRTKLDKHILQAILKSFVSSKLMIKEGVNVKLNLNYQPSIGRIKNGRIMIPMGKITAKQPVIGSSTTLSTSNTVQHPEGLSSQWKQELLRAAITRTIKVSGETFKEQELIAYVRDQVTDFSVGEFKVAVQFLLQNNYIAADGENYAYNLD